jgi:arylsulfatase A-like enzyme
VTTSDTYATTDTTDDAIAQIAVLPEPWFAYVAYNAPHSPWHVPPADLHGYVNLDENSPDDLKYDAAVEALDTEMGRLLASLSADVRARTTVIFMADNGTPRAVITAPFDFSRGKNTPYEGGIHVPLIVSGPLVTQPGTTTEALVHAIDVYPTVAHIAGVRLQDVTRPDLLGDNVPVTFDGQSLARWLADPAEPSIRDTLHMEQIAPNGGPDYTTEDIGIARNGRWKLISYPDHNQFYDLDAAVYDEGLDLLPGPLGPAQQNGFDLLREDIETHQAALIYEGPIRP